MTVAKDQNNTEPMLIDYKWICRSLSISVQHFYNLRDSGRFPVPHVRLGRSVRYNRKQVESWIESGCSVNWRPKR